MDNELRDLIREEIKTILNENKAPSLDDSYSDVPMDELHPGVRKAVLDWEENVSDEKKKNQPLLYYILKSGTPPYKMSQSDAQYSDDTGTQEQACANCEFLYQKVTTGEYICSQIRGKVKPGGWCNQWKAAEYIEDNEEE